MCISMSYVLNFNVKYVSFNTETGMRVRPLQLGEELGNGRIESFPVKFNELNNKKPSKLQKVFYNQGCFTRTQTKVMAK